MIRVALICLLALAAGCGSLYTKYSGVAYDPPGSTNVSARVEGVLSRRALGLKSSIPQFRVGPTNASVIETSGSLETSGDAAVVKSILQGVINGLK